MPMVDSSQTMENAASVCVASTAASRSATPTTRSGKIQRIGLRYVSTSSRATTEAVAMSRRVLAPSKTAARSAWTAAGPVTCAVTPSGRSALTLVRMSRTSSAVAVASVASTGTTASAAVPSSLRWTGARPAAGSCDRRPSMAVRSAGLRVPDVLLKSTTAVDPSASGSRSRSWSAAALSEPMGRASVELAVRCASPTALTTPIAPARARTTMATAHHLRVILSVTERTPHLRIA